MWVGYLPIELRKYSGLKDRTFTQAINITAINLKTISVHLYPKTDVLLLIFFIFFSSY